MTHKPKHATAKSRRQFLAGGTAATAAAAIAVAAGNRAGAPATTAQPAATESGGYRLSEHVKRYYETTRT